MKVATLMSTNVVTVSAEDRLVTAEELMGLRRFRHLPVVEARDRLVGVITDKDVVRVVDMNMSRSQRLAFLARTRVSDVMTRKVATVSPDMPIIEAAKLMITRKYGCLPVVEGETLVGILTEADFLRMVVSLIEHAQKDEQFMAQFEAGLKKTPKP